MPCAVQGCKVPCVRGKAHLENGFFSSQQSAVSPPKEKDKEVIRTTDHTEEDKAKTRCSC